MHNYFFSWAIVGGIVLTVFSQESGIINHVLQKVTGAPFPFLYVESSWTAIFVSSGIWKEAGFSAIIYLAALTSIGPSLYEAAKLDGASKWKQIFHMTIPGISSTLGMFGSVVGLLLVLIANGIARKFDKGLW